jgi:hypothetical protein
LSAVNTATNITSCHNSKNHQNARQANAIHRPVKHNSTSREMGRRGLTSLMGSRKPARLPILRQAAARTDASLSVFNAAVAHWRTRLPCGCCSAPNDSAVSLSATPCAAARTC